MKKLFEVVGQVTVRNYHAKLILHFKNTSLPYLKVCYCWCWNELFLSKKYQSTNKNGMRYVTISPFIYWLSVSWLYWFLIKMHFKGLHGRQNIENLWSPTLIVITGLILPGNYATSGQKGTKNKNLNILCANLEKNNLNQQNRH